MIVPKFKKSNEHSDKFNQKRVKKRRLLNIKDPVNDRT